MYFLRSFLGLSAKLRKATVSYVMSVRLFVRIEQVGSNWTAFHGIWCLNIFFLENLSRKFKFHWNLTRVTGTVVEDLGTFMIISRWILLRMGNVSDKSCREKQNTHLVFNNLFPNIVPFMRDCGKIWENQTRHIWQCSMTLALCMLDTYGYKHTLIIIIISNLSNDRCKASSKMIPPHSAI